MNFEESHLIEMVEEALQEHAAEDDLTMSDDLAEEPCDQLADKSAHDVALESGAIVATALIKAGFKIRQLSAALIAEHWEGATNRPLKKEVLHHMHKLLGVRALPGRPRTNM